MKTFYLHIGHGKTGTSYVQSALAQSIKVLEDSSIAYPMTPADRASGEEERISSGNGSLILNSVDCFEAFLNGHGRTADVSLLASSEQLFHTLADWLSGNIPNAGLERLLHSCREHGFVKLKVLIFVRDPVSFIPSYWQQTIKRHGNIQCLDTFAQERGADHLSRAAYLCRVLAEDQYVQLQIENYDKKKLSIIQIVENWLGLTPSSLSIPKQGTINRSLSSAELELQRQLNQLLGSSGFLSDRFCNELPSVLAEHQNIPKETAELIWHHSQEDVKEINMHLSKDDALHFSYPTDITPTDYRFTADQLALIALIIAEKHNAVEDLSQKLEEATKIPPEVAAEIDALRSALAERRKPVIPPEVTAELEALRAALRKA